MLGKASELTTSHGAQTTRQRPNGYQEGRCRRAGWGGRLAAPGHAAAHENKVLSYSPSTSIQSAASDMFSPQSLVNSAESGDSAQGVQPLLWKCASRARDRQVLCDSWKAASCAISSALPTPPTRGILASTPSLSPFPALGAAVPL